MEIQIAPGGTQMESSLMTGGDIAALGQTETAPSVRGRWLILLAALLVAFGVALAIGMATKSSAPAPAPTGALAPSVSASGPRAAITPLNSAVAVPGLKAPAKPKQHKTASTTSSGLTTSTPSASTQSTTPQTAVAQNTAPQQTTPQQTTQQQTTQQQTTASGGGGTVGVTHGGGTGGG
jgi:hypothetical protein